MELANPLVLLLISPVVLIAWYAIRRGVSRPLMISRVIILSLFIIALASPYTIGTTTIREDAPRITVISDKTMSMDLFKKDTGEKLFEAIKTKTPTISRQFTGLSSPIGDEILSASENNNIILVSDGNNNYGKDLFDAITFASGTGTRVFAVKQKPIHNDASVEIAGPKNLIIGNENVFNIIVKQAGETTSYRLEVEIDGASVESMNVVQTETTKVVQVSHIFTKLGTHTLKATITPSDDWFSVNNVFYKSVFVVPKPTLLMVTDDTDSRLFKVASGLYEVKNMNALPDDLKPYKAVIIDNRNAAQLGVDSLRNYVADGGGFVVVGGDAAYDKGNYNNSPVESLLPIISRAGEYRGGRNLVLAIDYSLSSISSVDPTTGFSFMSLINANAIKIVKEISADSNVAILAFGEEETNQTGIISMRSQVNRATLEKFVRDLSLKTGYETTALDIGLYASDKLLGTVTGTKEIIVISDGVMIPERMSLIKQAITDILGKNIKIHFVQVLMSYQVVKTPNKLYNELAQIAGEQVLVLNPDERATVLLKQGTEETPVPMPTPDITYEYPLTALDTEHFITKFINLTASVTGYNDITPKLGGKTLITTTSGKPILTVWGFGLGRVASFTTDNGAGETRWANAVYSGDNSRLISGMINWAIGDPRPREGVVIQAEDIWGGTPGRVVVTSNTIPQVKLDGTALDLSRKGPTAYEASINLEKEGFHDLSGYGIAVNYPLEYREVGFNEKLIAVIESNGGRVYSEDEVEGLLLLDIKEKAVRTVQEPKSQKEPFLLAALGLFLAEVIIRRLKDYRKERPDIQENPPRVAPAVVATE